MTAEVERRMLTLADLGAPGEVEEFWHPPTEQQQWDAAWVRRVWSESVAERNQLRRGLDLMGFLLIERTNGVLNGPGVLPTYDETWIGELGSLTMRWNRDLTAP